MPRSRDRHGRGIRGPLARPNAWGIDVARVAAPSQTEYFARCLDEAAASIECRCPDALAGIRIGIADVPRVTTHTSAVPLAEAVEPRDTAPAQIVLYRRPLEHRSATRSDLRSLVHRVLIEQVGALTTYSVVDLAGGDFDD